MRPIVDVLFTRNLKLAKLSEPSFRVSSKDILEGKYTPDDFMINDSNTLAFGGEYYDTNTNRTLNFMMSIQGGWEHLSVSMPSRTPTWDQMCTMKEIFFDDEEECVEYHPRKSEYIDAHPHCLHIWRLRMDDLVTMYQEMGWVVPNEETISMDDMLKNKFPDEKERNAVINIYKAEMGDKADLSEKMLFFDKVPSALILGMPTPPYTRVGMKTKEGLNALKEYASERGIKVGLTGNPDNLHYKDSTEEVNE